MYVEGPTVTTYESGDKCFVYVILLYCTVLNGHNQQRAQLSTRQAEGTHFCLFRIYFLNRIGTEQGAFICTPYISVEDSR